MAVEGNRKPRTITLVIVYGVNKQFGAGR